MTLHKHNLILTAIAIALVVVGYMLMSGPGSDNPEVFNPEVFHPRRITLAPIVVVSGYILIIVAIMRLPKQQSE